MFPAMPIPVTGYQVVVDGQSIIVGGTSAVAPLWAGLIALLNQKLGTPVGLLATQALRLGRSGVPRYHHRQQRR